MAGMPGMQPAVGGAEPNFTTADRRHSAAHAMIKEGNTNATSATYAMMAPIAVSVLGMVAVVTTPLTLVW